VTSICGPSRWIPADPGLTLLLYTAEPGSETEQALTFLASWATGNARADEKKATAPRFRPPTEAAQGTDDTNRRGCASRSSGCQRSSARRRLTE
jgi:hypothetical protein